MAKKKEFNLDEIKSEFEKLTRSEMIDKYHELGKHIHQLIENDQKEAEERLNKLKNNNK